MKVEIITVGNEVVYGYTINTNASYLAKEVQAIGMMPTYVTSICDDEQAIINATHLALSRADVILFTGGLGPTPDDLTKEAVCKALQLPLEVHEASMKRLKAYFKNIGRKMTPNNEKQVAFPKVATILPNDCGTAPGCMIQQDGKYLFLLPGPPNEMKTMFSQYAIPYLEKVSQIFNVHLDIKCMGIGESELATLIEPYLLTPQEEVVVATYVSNGEVIVRLTAYHRDKEKAKVQIEKVKGEIERCLKPYIIGYNEETLEENIVQLLLTQNLRVATAESCTGGLIAATLVNCSGVSKCFNEGMITYSNEVKQAYLQVQEETLKQKGAVSEETAREMAEGIRKKAQVDIGLSSTGIAGPEGGTKEKPVGLVYIGIATKEETQVFKLNLRGNRNEIRQRTVKQILFHLYKKLKNNLSE